MVIAVSISRFVHILLVNLSQRWFFCVNAFLPLLPRCCFFFFITSIIFIIIKLCVHEFLFSFSPCFEIFYFCYSLDQYSTAVVKSHSVVYIAPCNHAHNLLKIHSLALARYRHVQVCVCAYTKYVMGLIFIPKSIWCITFELQQGQTHMHFQLK